MFSKAIKCYSFLIAARALNLVACHAGKIPLTSPTPLATAKATPTSHVVINDTGASSMPSVVIGGAIFSRFKNSISKLFNA